MGWLFFLTVGLFIWSVTSLVDRYALADKVDNEKLYVLFPALVHLVVASAIIPFFDLSFPDLTIFLWAILGGVLELVKLYFLFTAMGVEEISRVFPLGSFSSFIVLFLSWTLLNDPLTGGELKAFFLFVFGGFFLVFKKSAAGDFELSKSWKPILGVGVVGAFEIIVLKFVFQNTNFWTGFYFSRIGLFLAGLVLFFSWARKSVVEDWNSLKPFLKKLLVGNQVVAVIGHVFYYFAIKLENAALVSSAMGMQHAMIFLMATGISLWKPSLLKEDLRFRELVKKFIGIALIVIAIVLLNR